MSSNLPVLQQSRWLRFGSLAVLYSSQGFPYGLFVIAIPAWFASQGLGAAEIGSFIAIVFLPWSFKLFAGPVMDKFTFAPMGRRRPWVLGAQLGIIVSFVLLGLLSPDPKTNFMLLAALGFLCNFFSALQDVAVDGMAIDILEEDERAQANAFMYGGQIAGISLATSLGGHALASYGLTVAALIMAMLVSLAMLVPVLLRERSGERVMPWSEGEATEEVAQSVGRPWKDIVGSLLKVLILPVSILLILIEGLSRVTVGIVTTISPVITVQELGWLQTVYSDWYAICGVIAAVIGVMVGPFVDRIGSYKTLWAIISFRVIMFIVVAYFSASWYSEYFFMSFVLINYVSSQIVTIAIIAAFMRICFPQVAATQFAVYMASANLTLSMGAAWVAQLQQFTDYSGMFYVAAGLNIAILLLLPLVNFKRHENRLQQMAGQPA